MEAGEAYYRKQKEQSKRKETALERLISLTLRKRSIFPAWN